MHREQIKSFTFKPGRGYTTDSYNVQDSNMKSIIASLIEHSITSERKHL